jgi:von Willebrand factor type A domain
MSEFQQYSLHWRGRESGPFTLGQIKHKIASGKISLEHEILADGRWISLHEFFAARGDGTGETGQPAKSEEPLPDHNRSRETQQSSGGSHPIRRLVAVAASILLLLGAIGVFWPRPPISGSQAVKATSTNSRTLANPTRTPREKMTHDGETQSPQQGLVSTQRVQARHKFDAQAVAKQGLERSNSSTQSSSKSASLQPTSQPSNADSNGSQSSSDHPNESKDKNSGDGEPSTKNSKSASSAASQLNSSAEKPNSPNDKPSGDSAPASVSRHVPNKSASNSENSSNDSPNSDSPPVPPKETPKAAQATSPPPAAGSSQSGNSAGAPASPPSADKKSAKPDSESSPQLTAQAASVGLNDNGKVKPLELGTGYVETKEFHPNSNVVFLVDQSYSMRGQKGKVAWLQLSNLLASLDTNRFFYIIFFHSSGYDPMPAPSPVPATPANVQSMLQWSSTARHVFGSKPGKAVLRALDFHPKTLWLISDGKFPKEVSAAITAINKSVGAQINTVGIDSRSGEENLRGLAEKNGGFYRFVPVH